MCLRCYIELEIRRLSRQNLHYEEGHPKWLRKNCVAIAKLAEQAKGIEHAGCVATREEIMREAALKAAAALSELDELSGLPAAEA